MSGGDPHAAERLLRERGVAGARVRPAGARGEIAAVTAPADSLALVRDLAPELKRLGFQYVALDLSPPAGAQDGLE